MQIHIMQIHIMVTDAIVILIMGFSAYGCLCDIWIRGQSGPKLTIKLGHTILVVVLTVFLIYGISFLTIP